jgi:murein DD-endopeptidase MepM/ murein hydrolase activator NlpD
MRYAPLMLLLLAANGPRTPAQESVPKADAASISVVNRPEEFEARRHEVEPVVLAHAGAGDAAERRALEDRLVGEYGDKAIEVLVRYREPHLIPVFVRLTESKKWYVRRLAVLGLQRNLALSGLDRIIAGLADENPLVREIAATTLAILHFAAKKHRKLLPRTREEAAARSRLGKRRKADQKALEDAREKEANPYVKASMKGALEAFGRRPLLLIHTEPTVGEPGVRFVPRLVGGAVNAYQKYSDFSGSGGGRLKPTSGWAYPTLLYPHEIMNIGSDRPLVPLPEKANSLHFGHDCSWFLEGSSIYAIADGVVRMIRSGGDWGGLIVVEYLGESGKVNGLNGHCGMWVFVKPGEAVARGQLLGQMGLSFSAENGGHGAHDHFGMFEGAFAAQKCYGRSPAGRSTEGWLIPPDFLTPKVEGKKIPPESYR